MSVETANQTTHRPDKASPAPDKRKLHPIALGVERSASCRCASVARRDRGHRVRSLRGLASRDQGRYSLSQLFRSNTPEFKQYEEVTRRFPSSEFDVLAVVEGKNLLAHEIG